MFVRKREPLIEAYQIPLEFNPRSMADFYAVPHFIRDADYFVRRVDPKIGDVHLPVTAAVLEYHRGHWLVDFGKAEGIRLVECGLFHSVFEVIPEEDLMDMDADLYDDYRQHSL